MIRAGFFAAAALAALAAVGVRPSVAEIYRPWCVQYLGGYSGATSCTFYSFEQCMETARGNGAYCYQKSLVFAVRGARASPRRWRPPAVPAALDWCANSEVRKSLAASSNANFGIEGTLANL